MTTVLPTNTCFDDSLDFLENFAKLYGPPPALIAAFLNQMTLVHGVCRMPGTNEPYAHAWVEHETLCIDAGLIEGVRTYYTVERDEFYAHRQVVETTRYTVAEAMTENDRSNTYGPWKPHLLALCRQRTLATVAVQYLSAMVTPP